ncbi:hypothetical protein BG015_004956 [Linnemannia schmuckeri]|uniref:F-box domain-containing protein n=1 Tax=Linnemannia schmuckeri TaxID=64567 RepID=A0A9P5S6V4_9FUNG|nr:hypothetical protein BG015_004956 [Linnemannia schmuckeri]
MKFPFLKKKQPSHNKQPITFPPELIQVPIAPSPLTIPEILERIFSYVDDFTLRRTVVLVCRLWHQMNQHLILREFVWDIHVPVQNIDKILSKLADTGRLRWFCDWGMPDEGSWDKLMRTLLHTQSRLEQPHGASLQRLPLKYQNSLRELELRTGTFKAGSLFDTIPFPPALTSFKFTVQEGSCNISLGRLLETCPLLEEFHGEVMANYLFLLGSMVPSDVGEGTQRRLLPLRSLVLTNAAFAQSSLEALLLVTPRIQELKLISLQPVSTQGANWITNKYSRADLVQHIQSLPIMLHSFHFSVFNQGVDGPEADEMLTPLSPLETGRSLWGDGLTPTLMRKLDEGANFITTLELYWRRTGECSTSSWLLHRFMCRSRHLLHVRTTNIAFQFEHLDLHRRAPTNGPSDTASILTGVWACTNLRTLHLELHGHNQSQLMHPTNSRIVFGYISTVCPRLQDLQLVIPKMCRTQTGKLYFNKPSMRLEGGFVLLTRLKYLERLFITSFAQPTHNERTHVNWMVLSGRTAEFRKKRREMMAGWELIKKEQLALKDPAEITRLSLMDKDVLRWGELETTTKRELWRLGLLLEVKKVLEQMDTDGFECWPLLHRVSFNGGFEQGPEACLRNLFVEA